MQLERPDLWFLIAVAAIQFAVSEKYLHPLSLKSAMYLCSVGEKGLLPSLGLTVTEGIREIKDLIRKLAGTGLR